MSCESQPGNPHLLQVTFQSTCVTPIIYKSPRDRPATVHTGAPRAQHPTGLHTGLRTPRTLPIGHCTPRTLPIGHCTPRTLPIGHYHKDPTRDCIHCVPQGPYPGLYTLCTPRTLHGTVYTEDCIRDFYFNSSDENWGMMSPTMDSPDRSGTLEIKELPNSTAKKFQNGSVDETTIFIELPKHGAPQRKPPTFCSLRKLAIMSIVCGVSCVGIKALLLAVRAEEEVSGKDYEFLARRSRRLSVLSIALFVGGLICLPFLVVFISYIMTLIE
ncbi:transmembrane protein 265 [Pyxicephalus adspersus]|uniref:transmembrane protein 265 n=1 Tax=Pyxicephalus adspersus TaxID=30357 RepID=UPI003B5AF142